MAPQVDLSIFVKHHADGGASLDLAVDGITCAACIGDIEGALKNLPGLLRARVNYTNHRLTVEWAAPSFDPAQVIEALARINYRAYPFIFDETEEREARRARWLLRCLAVAGFAAMNIMLLSVSDLGRQCERHDAGDARFLSLAFGAHRPARRRLRRPALLSERDRRDAREKPQYGCADLDRHSARAHHVGRRDGAARA